MSRGYRNGILKHHINHFAVRLKRNDSPELRLASDKASRQASTTIVETFY